MKKKLSRKKKFYRKNFQIKNFFYFFHFFPSKVFVYAMVEDSERFCEKIKKIRLPKSFLFEQSFRVDNLCFPLMMNSNVIVVYII
jgi:hypothetical protein